MKRFPLSCTAKAITLGLLCTGTLATAHADDTTKEIEVITITHQRHQQALASDFATGKTSSPDLAHWLLSVPGANINRNGPVTGIAQYRGLYGDRVATTLDGHPVIGAGPNAMDTPLSYSTPLIVDSMTVYRGITPVSAGIDTVGGAIEVNMRKAEIANSNDYQLSGDLQAGYRSNNSANTLSAVVNSSANDWAIMAYGNIQDADNIETGDGLEVRPTEFQKRQFGTDIRIKHEGGQSGLSYHYTDTQDSGTPALPMDIEYIYSHRVSLDGEYTIAHWQTTWQLGYMDADHAMTNFLMRENSNLDKYRRNNAVADTIDFKFTATSAMFGGELALGLDGYLADHDSVITNPNNAMFKVVNFNQVEDDRFGLYAQWQSDIDNSTLQLGARIKHARSDAGDVYTSMAMMQMMSSDTVDSTMDSMMAMPSMGAMASELMDDFNNADRSVSDTDLDLAASLTTTHSQTLSSYIGLGLKHRAPSYQERFLWTPMESTGGLADGNTYIGDINLESERALQADIGLTYQNESLMVSPHIFYQQIDDYIQGTPLGMEDMTASMMANMMSGDDNPLKFSNVDAKLYGFDVDLQYRVNSNWQVTSLINYVRGERRDIDDELYRIAPLNGQVSLHYAQDNFTSSVSVLGVAAQNKVSMTNDEQATSGYGLVNLEFQYFANSHATLRGGVDNVLDRNYQNHLGGYNRVKGSEIPVMERLPGEGVSAWVELSYSF